MRKLLSILCTLFVMVSCQEIDRTPKPDKLIPEDKMVEVLTELSLLHGARSYNMSLMKEKGINAYPYLTEKFGIDSTQLVQSNNYYSQNYEQYQKIYERVKERLEVLMAEYDSIRELEEKERNSLRNLIRNDSVVPGNARDSIKARSKIDLTLPVPRTRRRQ